MAWYEETGPDARQVRDIVFKEMEALYPTLSPNYIKNSLQKSHSGFKKRFWFVARLGNFWFDRR